MRKIREEIDRNEERFPQLSDKVDKNKMADAGMAAELQGLQEGEERKGSNASQAVDCCMETMVDQFIAMGADQARSKFDAMCQVFFEKFEAYAPPVQMPGKGGGRRNSGGEQEQDKANQQLALSASSGCNEGTPASTLELDLSRIRAALGECGGAGMSGTAKDERKRPSSKFQVDVPWKRKRMLHWKTCEGEKVEGIDSKKEERKDKQPGKGPKNLQRTSGKVASSEEAKGEEVEEKEEETG